MDNIDNSKLIKSGFVTIVGRPNVGKSTLLNEIMQKKISIVTKKPQTTRNQIKGIFNTDDLQIVIIDTPGIHKHHNLLGKHMNRYALKSLSGVDIIMFVAPFNEEIKEDDLFILEQIKKEGHIIFLVISKMDTVSDESVDKKILEWTNKFNFDQIIPISSKNKININKLLELIKKTLPLGPRYFPEDQFTDQPERFLIKEIIREQILKITNQEVPHSTSVLINSIKEDKKIMKIYASIVVERQSQKKIMVGKNGNIIKEIGTSARKDIESFFNIKIFLDLFVKVEEKWREDQNKLKTMGYGKKEQY